jgi:PAS domain S-box-containing protein
MSTGDLNVLRAQSFFVQCPEAVGVITDEGVLVASNVRFERTVGPASKLEGRNFLVNVVSAEDHARFKIAMQRARAACSGPSVDAPDGCASDLVEWASTPTMRSCATMALGNEGDFPVWRKMDWTLSVFDDTRSMCMCEKGERECILARVHKYSHLSCSRSLILTGRLSSMGPAAPGVEVSAEMGGEEPYFEPPAERELLDFLNKAPIAMHWLSGTGHVLWANETELNVLGYTAEEYIGQPIMNFCPDESELVLEVFKSLGSGNAIKDVPVRFRTKDGRVKHLLIDSNVNWNADGSFRHTRCFIRDDTLRKVREERLRVTREKEEELSNAKDVFFRKVFHDIRTPTHEIAGKIRELQTWVAALPEGDQEGTVKTKSLVLDWQKLLSLVEDAADATLYHMGKVPLLNNTQPFSVKRALQMVCGDMLAEGRVALGVSCTVALGIGHSNEIPWSAASSQVFIVCAPFRNFVLFLVSC